FSVSFGGIDMDNSIIEYIKSLKNIEISSSVAEKLKNECGSLYLQDTTNMEILGVDLDTKRPVNEIITASEVRDAIIHYFENIKTGIEHLLYSCTADIISDVSLNGVYVVGGIANFVGLENYLSKKLNLHIIIPDEPENCTVLGANSCDEYY
ncbi:MAG: rod shape-determining protein, partial [Clostridiales bacterium]|nr:rod shape-determining protein [Candidatus Apopatousia equi]